MEITSIILGILALASLVTAILEFVSSKINVGDISENDLKMLYASLAMNCAIFAYFFFNAMRSKRKGELYVIDVVVAFALAIIMVLNLIISIPGKMTSDVFKIILTSSGCFNIVLFFGLSYRAYNN